MPFTKLTRRRVAHHGTAFIALMVALSGTGGALAQALPIQATTTPLVSTSERMVSYRHQERMWYTPDGTLHLLLNRGLLSPRASLTLYSSRDNGTTWQIGPALPDTNRTSTADGALEEYTLQLVYSTRDGWIAAAQLLYDPARRTWSRVGSAIVAGDPGTAFMNPALALDALGVAWCTYVGVDGATQDTSIRLSRRADDAGPWQATGHLLGEVDRVSIERSARPVPIPGGMGIVFAVHEKLTWAWRANGSPADSPWAQQPLFTAEPPYDTDPFASHFSVVTDDRSNVHVVTVDKGRLLYMRWRSVTSTWDPARVMTSNIGAGYVQASVAGGTLVVTANTLAGNLRVWQSTNHGYSFQLTHQLLHDAVAQTPAASFRYPRMESPGRVRGPLMPVMQQYEDAAAQRLMSFQVPVLP